MPVLIANQIRINCAQMGEGPDLVAIHGLAANVAYWYFHFAPALADACRITAYDLRGHGLSEMPPGGYTTETMAADLLALLDALHIERAHLVGHSFGGAVALHAAVLEPQRVASVSLIDSRLNAIQPMHRLDDAEHWASRRKSLEAAGIAVSDETPRVIYAMLEELLGPGGAGRPNGGLPSSAGWPGLIIGTGGWNPQSRTARRWMKLVRTTSFAEDMYAVGGLTPDHIAQVRAPALLSYGQQSGCMPTCRVLQQLLPDAAIRIHPGLGHFFPSVHPEIVVEDVRAFLDTLARATAVPDGKAVSNSSSQQPRSL
jgi:pimeloyl-ACP methyl ester carboxylesterase